VTQRFEGAVGVVTGGSSGIGAAIVERLIAEGTRAIVVIAAAQDADDLHALSDRLSSDGQSVVPMTGDVADGATATEAVRSALEFGKLDFLINNAGFAYSEPVLETPVEHLERLFAVNVKGCFLMSVAAAKEMKARGGGAIVNTASTSGWLGDEEEAVYNSSKAALIELTRSLAVDLAQFGIRVNAVAPGLVDTRRTKRIIDNKPLWAKYRTRIPMDRPATPAEIASVHLFLVSSDAAYVTGSVFTCDGGLTAGCRFSNWEAATTSVEGVRVGDGADIAKESDQ
jgi:meso-butanediol dehydrogenase/(S,S)-butanediol dehydrogenase/diacetyl reductase